MNSKETLARLSAADPALAVTEEDLARSRERSLAVMRTDAEQLAVGSSGEQSPPRRLRLVAGLGLVAVAAAVIVGVAVTETSSQVVQPAEPAVSSPLPEVTGVRMPTFEARIVTGANGNKAAVATDPEAENQMDALNTGKLGLNGGGCIARVDPDGSSSGLIFPRGTLITGTGVVLPDGTAISLGQQFAFGGGNSPENTELGECAPTGTAFLVQNWDALPSK